MDYLTEYQTLYQLTTLNETPAYQSESVCFSEVNFLQRSALIY